MKRLFRFIETCREGNQSRMVELGGTYHGSRLDENHIFGVVELETEQQKILDLDEDVTLFRDTRPIHEGKNLNPQKKRKHLEALKVFGIDENDTGDEVGEKLYEKLGNPALL